MQFWARMQLVLADFGTFWFHFRFRKVPAFKRFLRSNPAGLTKEPFEPEPVCEWNVLLKEKQYTQLYSQVKSLIEGETDLIANLANVSALLFNTLEDVNWAGFYLYKEEQLVLGPFQGQPACIRIPLGKGVCGTAASTKTVQRIEDVHAFDGHIACDAASNSEIVIPIVIRGELLGVLDIDSPLFGRFDEHDERGLTAIVDLIQQVMESQWSLT